MRKLLKTLVAGAALAMLVAWPVLANHAGQAHTVSLADGGVIAGCFTDGDDLIVAGTVEVTAGTDDFQLTLMGNLFNDGSNFNPIAPGGGLVNPITIINTGPGTYDFEFNVSSLNLSLYNSLRVDSTSPFADPEKSLSFKPDCDTPIDEAPFAILLLVTGGLAALWFASRQMKAPAQPTAA
jgi:hypothetical protein